MAKKVTPSELRDWLRASPESLAIIDVRDDDHYGGHILGSKNYPSHKLADNLPGIIEQTKDKKRIVFHCSLSQQRGPKASRMFAEARRLIGDKEQTGPEVYILEGGVCTDSVI